MKRTILVVMVLALCVSGAYAQVFKTLTLATNGVPVAYTNSYWGTNVGATIDTMRQTKTLILVSAKSTSTTNAAVAVFGFDWSLDGTTFYALGSMRLPLTMNGTNTVTAYTNLDTSWFRYVRPGLMENVGVGTSNDVANVTVKYFFK
jgi:hypothetical protein